MQRIIRVPRFYFDTHNGNHFDRDTSGQDLPDREAARWKALEALPDMTQDELPNGDFITFYVNVRDEDGRAIYTACMSLVGRWLD